MLVIGDRLGFYLFRHYGEALYRRIALLTLTAIGAVTTLRALV